MFRLLIVLLIHYSLTKSICKLRTPVNLAILLLCCAATLVSTHFRVHACELHQFDKKHLQAGDTAPEPAPIEPVPAAPPAREGVPAPAGDAAAISGIARSARSGPPAPDCHSCAHDQNTPQPPQHRPADSVDSPNLFNHQNKKETEP